MTDLQKPLEIPAQDSEALLESAIDIRLAMTIEERIEAHQNALILIHDLKAAGELANAKSQSPA